MRGPLGRGWLAQVGESLSMLLAARGSGRCGGFAQTACAHRATFDRFWVYLGGGVPYVCEWLLLLQKRTCQI